MAKYQVISFDIKIDKTDLYLTMMLINSGGNTVVKQYRINGDTRFTLEYMKAEFPQALQRAIDNYIKIELSHFKDRFYLFISLPIKDDYKLVQHQVTAHVI